jgi:hypothetical protein
MTTVTKASIVELLKTDDRAVARALVVLNERQTADEQASEETRYRNGRGFRPCHARMGTSMAKFFTARGYLTAKQIAYFRKPDVNGKMRIEIYAGQLLEVAEAKAAARKQADAIAVMGGAVNPSPKPARMVADATVPVLAAFARAVAAQSTPKTTLAARAMLSEREMQEMEADNDIRQTRTEELNKFLARCQMEKG